MASAGPCLESFCHPVILVTEAWSRVLADGASAPGRYTPGGGSLAWGGSVIGVLRRWMRGAMMPVVPKNSVSVMGNAGVC